MKTLLIIWLLTFNGDTEKWEYSVESTYEYPTLEQCISNGLEEVLPRIDATYQCLELRK